jgi:hypothetical protein
VEHGAGWRGDRDPGEGGRAGLRRDIGSAGPR